ncbi:MAG: hypothetical protein J0I20_29825 [Chloroflexi bacterium]|nr:hypothetical protein [Chloroflexota bacterium]OJV99114.1 MAG: hypothetical protein BGO39_16805 [Chloroflexi bacterium 54-19]
MIKEELPQRKVIELAQLEKGSGNAPAGTSQAYEATEDSLSGPAKKPGRKTNTFLGLGGVSVLLLCALCCSVPVVGSSLAIGGTALLGFVNLSWLWLTLVLLVLLTAIIIFRARRDGRLIFHAKPQSSFAGQNSCARNGGKCQSDQSCGCGK